jgi:O-acetyl-ADP-ribose deacetylase (regulator of RNase III)
MRLAADKGAHSIAFPAISAGVYGYPLNEAGEIAVRTVAQAARQATSVERVRFVLFDEDALAAFPAALEALNGD